MKTPIELLKDNLNDLEKALHKSFESFKAGKIDHKIHDTHKENLNPMIFKYKQAINCLNQWLD